MTGKPLSPHLQIYRLPLIAVLSITHRITGVLLSAGTVLLLYWLVAAAMGADAYAAAARCLASVPSQIVLVGWTFAFYFHLANGIRHLLWDTGWGFDLDTADRTGYAVIAVSAIMTVLTWWCVIAQGGMT